MKASIDIGSNSILLLAGEFEGKKFTAKINEAEVASLGKDLDKTGMFAKSSMEAAFDILKAYKDKLSNFQIKPEEVIVTATEAARVAKNASEFFEKIKNQLGFEITIITGEAEAYFSSLGVSLGSESTDDIVIMDIGGASTEFIAMSLTDNSIEHSISLPIGSVRMKNWSEDKVKEAKFSEVSKTLHNTWNKKSKSIVAIAGTMTCTAAMIKGLKKYSDEEVHGMNVSLEKLLTFYHETKNLSEGQLKTIYPFLGKRAPIICYGMEVAIKLAQELSVDNFEISTYGLRYGTLFQGRIDGKYISK